MSVLDGGFPALVQALLQRRGTVEPVLMNHDALRWERYLKATGREEYLPMRYEASARGTGETGRSDSPLRQHVNYQELSELERLNLALRTSKSYGHNTVTRIVSEKIDMMNKLSVSESI